jgi:hypothetical protein
MKEDTKGLGNSSKIEKSGIKNPACKIVKEYGWYHWDKTAKKYVVKKESDLGAPWPTGYICNPKNEQVESPKKTSIHYAISQAGIVVQGARENMITHHAGNYNGKSVGIEICGPPQVGNGQGYEGKYSKMYTKELVEELANLVADICKRNGIVPSWNPGPKIKYDRKWKSTEKDWVPGTILGHDQYAIGNRSDPGTHIEKTKGPNDKNCAQADFDWPHFMDLVMKVYNG